MSPRDVSRRAVMSFLTTVALFDLQLAVQSTAVKELAIWAISNPQLNVEFERRSASLLRLDSWVDINGLDDNNAIQDVCQRGFRTGDSGQTFNVGSVQFAEDGQIQHQYLLCSLAVGKSFVLDGPEADRKLPAGYDSLYVHDASAEAGPDGTAYRHKYMVFDNAQVLPRYVVHFTYDPASPAPRQKAGEINLAELKAKISDALSVLGPSASAAAEKMLADVGSGYETALRQSSETDSLLDERKRSIHDALRLVDDKLASIQGNSKAVEDALYARMQEAVFALQDATQKKMNALLSEELELRRQLGQIGWIESFVTTMQETLPPMSFISAWERHVAVRSSMYGALGGRVSTRALEEIQPDMALVGSVQVVCGKQAAASMAAAASAATAGAPGSVAGSTTSSAAVAPSPAKQLSQANANDLLSTILRAQVGAGSEAGSAPSPAASLSAAVPIVTQEQARANVDRARADLQAVEAMVATLPKDLRAQGEAARAQAKARLQEADNLLAALTGRQMGGAAPSSASSSSSTAAPAAPTGSQAQATGAGATAATPAVLAVRNTATSASMSSAPSSLANAVRETPRPAPTQTLEARLARFSMRKEAERKSRQRGLDTLDPSLAFPESALLAPDQAAALYLCLPWGGGMMGLDETLGGFGLPQGGLGSLPPVCRLLFSSEKHYPPTVTTLMTNYMQGGNRDATVLVVRANGYVFGGYAADPWDLSQLYGGTPRCFLFSVTRDVRVPFTGRARGPRQANDDELRLAHEHSNAQAQAEFEALVQQARESSGQEPTFDEAGRLLLTQPDENGMPTLVRIPVPRPKPFIRHDALRSGPDFLQFGLKDLVLRGDFSECSSELEQSYGLGLRPDEARALLAGSPSFRVEAVELWAVSPSGTHVGEGEAAGMGYAGDYGGGMMQQDGSLGAYTTPMH